MALINSSSSRAITSKTTPNELWHQAALSCYSPKLIRASLQRCQDTICKAESISLRHMTYRDDSLLLIACTQVWACPGSLFKNLQWFRADFRPGQISLRRPVPLSISLANGAASKDARDCTNLPTKLDFLVLPTHFYLYPVHFPADPTLLTLSSL